MGEGAWDIRGKELWLLDPDGNARVSKVDEVYRALIEKKPSEEWIPAQVEGLRPSRYPLDPVVVIDDAEGDGVPVFSLSGSCRGKTITLQPDDLERGHVVADGVWYPVEPDQSSEIIAMLSSSGVALGRAGSLRSFLAIRKATASGLIEDNLADRNISPLAFTPAGEDLPEGVNATLYPYQASGWRWLKFLLSEQVGGLLADEMGLGKTLQIISALRDCGAGPLRPALIAAPGSLLENWRREIEKFAPDLKVLKHHGPDRTGRPADLQGYDVVVTSYDSVVRDNSLLSMIDWQVIVLDEAQYIRNPAAQRTKAVKALTRKVGLAVTGTPVENRLLDLWSIMDFVLPGHLGDAGTFQTHFQDDVDGAAALEPLVSPLMLRRRVAEVAKDLPPRIDIPQAVELDEEEAARYDALRDRIAAQYGAAATLVALTAMRRFCAHPVLTDNEHATGDPMAFSKFRRLDELVEEIFALGEKVIIFTSFTGMADLIAQHIARRHNAFTGIIDGRLAIDDRQPLIDTFGAVKGGAALILNPRAGGAGLNITAANHVIHYNPEWNPALEDQASARAHRRGQDRPVTIHRLLVANTVEDVIDERLTRKRAISGTAVIGVEGGDDDYADIVAALGRSPLAKRGN
ncbi:DEAD/DEAH box helicase [Sphingobium vermicomposti]|uniref:SNF2 family DNA or RNA helicase n=1 Tax=Sphingobium vermicomposti TaxID=529005 RepID=A0A846M276_9SPHN|nr:DEAD/DEAH box helicase [Sphingobium vermicomposti]NIJ16032.1 SNF2 family DNA or RNA helicase [Sphingobium vermicomposti]